MYTILPDLTTYDAQLNLVGEGVNIIKITPNGVFWATLPPSQLKKNWKFS